MLQKRTYFLIGPFPCPSLPNHLLVSFFSVHTLLFIPNDSLWVFNANLVKRASAGPILLSVRLSRRHDATRPELVLTSHLRIGATMNMVIKSHASQVTSVNWCLKLCAVECIVCECCPRSSPASVLLNASKLQEVTTLGQPLEVLKTQMAANRSQTMVQAIRSVWARGGVAGFYQGLIPWVCDRVYLHVISFRRSD